MTREISTSKVHPIFRNRYRKILTRSSFLAFLFTAVAGADSLSEQLLESFYATAGICTSSQVQSIEESDGIITIGLEIEAATKRALQNMQPASRQDWLSLHCPPQIHGVWLQQSPPGDIIIDGPLSATDSEQLSCISYQRRDTSRQMSIADKIRARINKLLLR